MTQCNGWVDDLYDRVCASRERIMAALAAGDDPSALPVVDGPAEMIAVNEMAKEGLIRFDSRWRITAALPGEQNTMHDDRSTA